MKNTSSNDANLKIPQVLINVYHLRPLAILVYSEVNGIYSKYHKCYITDKELTRRLNRSVSSIQRAIAKLKELGLIQTKQKPNYKGRYITLTPVSMDKYLLIPVKIVRNKDLSLGALMVYGSLYSRHHKQIKVNADKHQENASLIISVTNQELANELGKTSRFIQIKVKELLQKNYIAINSINGVGVEINLLPVDNSKKDGRPLDNLRTKCVATNEQNEHPPTNKMRSHLRTKRATNKYLIDNINKDDYSSSSNKDHPQAVDPFDPFEVGEPLKEPVYYDSIPNDDEMPPNTNNDETSKDIAELNTLDIQNATQHKTSPITGKSGSESGNKYIDRSTKPTRKKYHAYNGFNLDYQVDQLRKMLNSKTGKHYPITNQRPLIEQRLKDGFTLYDFEKAIDYLIQQRRTISIRKLVININNYLNKINSN
ncbi:helix-turn-helix domain-containing protein [Lactobacillus amylovorus]|uniref:helix-turn-helix domain-containing protein n=1 Tax=Lactobacillus amylovorus TaxID=1604 RepID=UPI00232D6373|nr:HTH domain-containing protein [Lactobacillus amylovorus]MDB6229853.1 HTH domain-containing protein [Lactobacillus amylovorus]